jgi:hypothetical protein
MSWLRPLFFSPLKEAIHDFHDYCASHKKISINSVSLKYYSIQLINVILTGEFMPFLCKAKPGGAGL